MCSRARRRWEVQSDGAYFIRAADLDSDGFDDLVVPSSWDDVTEAQTTSRVFWGGPDGFGG